MHKHNNELHEQKALLGAALGAITGYSRKGRKGAATGAVLGGLTALIAGEQAINAF
ncbi:MAG: YMGG-like glycine zipper-containing protein [Candidatus Nanohaloarchaea archaeon]